MPDKRITDLPSGGSLQAGDKVLVARGDQNVYVTGASIPAVADFLPPIAKMFPYNGPYGGTATSSSLIMTDHALGLQFTSGATDWNTGGPGFRMAVRPIPSDQRDLFTVTAHMTYTGLNADTSGVGLAFTTGSAGKIKSAVILRVFNGSRTAPWTYYLDPTNSNTNNQIQVAGDYSSSGSNPSWFRGVVVGTTLQMFASEDAITWALLGQYDFGQPITGYGIAMMGNGKGVNTALCDYFDSSELQADPTIRQTGAITPDPVPASPYDVPHQYWRLNVQQNWGGDYVAFGDIEMRTAIGNSDLCYNGTPISSAYSGGYGPNQSFIWNAPNGQVSSSYPGWQSTGTTGWIGYTFSYPVVVKEIAYSQFVNGGYGTSPRDMTLEWSDDGITWHIARTYTDLPVAEYHTFTYTNTDPSDDVSSQPDPNALSLGLSPTGRRAAYSVRRLYDDYNGPLMQIRSYRGNFDVYAVEDGYIDQDFITAVSGGGDVAVAKWYDQSGNGLDAVPMQQAQITAIGNTGYCPMIAIAGKITTANDGVPSVLFLQSPMDIMGLDVLSEYSFVLAGVKFGELSFGHCLSAGIDSAANKATDGTWFDCFSLGVNADGSVGGIRNSAVDYIGGGTNHHWLTFNAQTGINNYGYLVCEMGLNGSTAGMSANFNKSQVLDEQSLALSTDAVPNNHARIGGAAWLSSPTASYNNTVNNSHISEVIVYDASQANLDDLYGYLCGTYVKGIPHTIIPNLPFDIAPLPVLPTADNPATTITPKFKLGQPGSSVYGPGSGNFVVPTYQTLTIEAYGAGGASGEGEWGGTHHGFDAPGGMGTFVCTGQPSAPGSVQWPSSAGGFALETEPTSHPGVMLAANGGLGGNGWDSPSALLGQYNLTDANALVVNGGPADAVVTGGGSPGGAYAPGDKGVFSGGLQGRNGGYARKVIHSTDAGAPVPGQTLFYYVGKGGYFPQCFGTSNPGTDGKLVVTWA